MGPPHTRLMTQGGGGGGGGVFPGGRVNRSGVTLHNNEHNINAISTSILISRPLGERCVGVGVKD